MDTKNKPNVNVATFLKEYIRLCGEVHTLHGRHELSKEGFTLMRDLLGHAMEGLRDKSTNACADKTMSPKYAAKELPTNGPDMLRGYRVADLIAARSAQTRNHASLYQLRDGQLYFGESKTPLKFITSDYEWTAEEMLMRKGGLRRPDEKDYKPLA